MRYFIVFYAIHSTEFRIVTFHNIPVKCEKYPPLKELESLIEKRAIGIDCVPQVINLVELSKKDFESWNS